MKIFLSLSLILMSVFSMSSQWSEDQDEVSKFLPGFNLIWSDEFDETQLDESKWELQEHCSPQNAEAQCYTSRRDNVRVNGGNLLIQAKQEYYWNREYTSARLHGKQGWTYGYYECKAKIPKGKHLWPAIWMMPLTSEFGEWPRSGEIDIMEARGQETNLIQATIHYGISGHQSQTMGMFSTPFDLSSDFHKYGFLWTREKMEFFIDGFKYYEVNLSLKLDQAYPNNADPFTKPFYWILNVAVGGVYFPRDKYGDVTVEEARHWPKPVMEVDYVRVYQPK